MTATSVASRDHPACGASLIRSHFSTRNEPHVTLDCDALLFDMDGTLVDSTEVVERHWGSGCSPRHRPRRGAACLARPSDAGNAAPRRPPPATVEEAATLDAGEAGDSEGLRQVRGAAELLASLPLDRWAVVTSAGRALATRRLRGASVPGPDVLVTSDDVSPGKPNPKGFWKPRGDLARQSGDRLSSKMRRSASKPAVPPAQS